MYGQLIILEPYFKRLSFLNKFPLIFCQKSAVHACEGLFLDSLCSTDLFVYLMTVDTVLITAAF